MAVKKKKIILLVGILIIICGMFSGCGKGSPDENDAKSNVMYEYYCVKEPELVNSYEDEDMYVFEYNLLPFSSFKLIKVSILQRSSLVKWWYCFFLSFVVLSLLDM